MPELLKCYPFQGATSVSLFHGHHPPAGYGTTRQGRGHVCTRHSAFMLSRDVAQWLFLAGALVMVWEFCAMLQLSRRCKPCCFWISRFWFAGFTVHAVGNAGRQSTSSCHAGTWWHGCLLVGAITRDLAAAVFVGLLVLCILSGRNLLGRDGGITFTRPWVCRCRLRHRCLFCGTAGRWAPTGRDSPNKTLSGAAGGMFAAVIGGVILLQLVDAGSETRFTFAFAMCAGIVIAVLAQAGDLFESFIKRRRV